MPPIAPRRTLRALAAAALLTLTTYLLLPCMEILSRRPSRVLPLRSIDLTDPPPAPPPPPKEIPLGESRPTQAALPKPRLAAPPARLPVSLAMNLDLVSGIKDGDFDMDFGIAPPGAPTSIGEGVFELFELDEPPRPLVRIEPFYPIQARMHRIEGAVVLEFVVDAAGKPRDIQVVSAAPGRVFVEAAVRAVNRWRFAPGTREGKPVAVRVRQKITFEMEE